MIYKAKVLLIRSGQITYLKETIYKLRDEFPGCLIDIMKLQRETADLTSYKINKIIKYPFSRIDLKKTPQEIISSIEKERYSKAVFMINKEKEYEYTNILNFLRYFHFDEVLASYNNGNLVSFNELHYCKYKVKCYYYHFLNKLKQILSYLKDEIRLLTIIPLGWLQVLFYNLFRRKINKDPSKVLLIIDKFPPLFHGGNVRWVKFIKYISDKFDFTVFTSSEDKNRETSNTQYSLLEEIPGKTDIIRKEYIHSRGRLFSKIDEYMVWSLWSFSQVYKMVKNKNIGQVIVSGPLFSPMIIGYYLKKILNITLILDLRDEWTISRLKSFQRLNTSYNRKWEKKMFKVADTVVVTTESQKKCYEEHFPFAKNKIKVITNGCDDEEYLLLNQNNSNNHKNICIDYFGTLNSDRHHIEFYQAIDTLMKKNRFTDIKLRTFGRYIPEQPEQEMLQFGALIEKKGMRDRGEILKIIKNETNILLTIAEIESHNYIAGKSYEMLLSGKPVIALVPQGEAYNLFQQFEGVFTASPDNKDEIVKAFEDCLMVYRQGSHSYDRNHSLSKYFHRNIAKEFAFLLGVDNKS